MQLTPLLQHLLPLKYLFVRGIKPCDFVQIWPNTKIKSCKRTGKSRDQPHGAPRASVYAVNERNMSILNYFKYQKPEERGLFLPTPVSTECISEEEVAACNKEIEALVEQQRSTKQPYHSYSSQQRT